MSPGRWRACVRTASTCRRASSGRRESRITGASAPFSRRCMVPTTRRDPDARGYFGAFGGRFVPETLVEPIEELTAGYFAARADAAFRDELDRLLRHYVGRPTPVYEAR